MKTYYNKLLILIILFTIIKTTLTFAQATKPAANVTGTVLDDKGIAMPYATVGLLKAQDSSLVKGAITNESGNYNFEHVAQGTYIYVLP